MWKPFVNKKALVTCSACSDARSCLTLCDPRTIARQAPLSMGFFRQENWIGLPFLHPGDHPDPRIEPQSPVLQADSLPTELPNSGEQDRGGR